MLVCLLVMATNYLNILMGMQVQRILTMYYDILIYFK
jgi:hypothetical protein